MADSAVYIELASNNGDFFTNSLTDDVMVRPQYATQRILLGTSNGAVAPFVVTSNAVGILTTNPAYTLDVAGNVNFTGTLNQNGAPYIGSQWSNNASNVFLLSSNVGIGKSNPAYKLDVAGDINLSGLFYQNGAPYIGSQWSNNSTNVFLLGSNVGIGTSNPGNVLSISGSSGAKINNVYIGNSTVSGQGTWVQWNRDGGSGSTTYATNKGGGSGGHIFGEATNANSFTEYMRLSGTGSLGIGTTSPSEKLDIAGNIKASSNAYIMSRLGVNTSNPGFALDVNGDVNFTGILNQNGIPYIGSQWSNNSSNIFIFGSNIGINTSNAVEDFTVVGGKIYSDTQHLGSSNDSSNVPSFSFREDSNTGLYHACNATMGFVAGGVESFRVTPGDLRINQTLYCGSNLNVASNIIANGSLTMNNRLLIGKLTVNRKIGGDANITKTSILGFSNVTDGIILDMGSNTPTSNQSLRVTWSNSTEIARFTGDGKVGIGTNNPSTTLDVSGTINATNFTGATITSLSNLAMFGSNTAVSASNTTISLSNYVYGTNTTNIAWASNVGLWSSNNLFNKNTGGTITGGTTISRNVGIGSGSPVLQVTNNSSNLAVFVGLPAGNYNGCVGQGDTALLAGYNAADTGSLMLGNWGNSNAGIRIDKSGNIGVGTNNPSYRLDVAGSINTTGMVMVTGGSNCVQLVGGNNPGDMVVKNYAAGDRYGMGQYTGGITRLFTSGVFTSSIRLSAASNDVRNGGAGFTDYVTVLAGTTTNAGYVGVGTGTPSANLHVNNDFHIAANAGAWNSTAGKGIFMRYSTNGQDAAYIQSITRSSSTYQNMAIQASNLQLGSTNDFGTATNSVYVRYDGNVGIGTASPSQKLNVNGTILASADVIAYSDRRLKSNITIIDDALTKLHKLSGYTFNTVNDDRKHTGLIAQEVQDVLPEAVYQETNEDGTPGNLSLAYGNMAGLLVEAIKEIDNKYKKENEALRQEVAELRQLLESHISQV